jgi:hypothetical protein
VWRQVRRGNLCFLIFTNQSGSLGLQKVGEKTGHEPKKVPNLKDS